MAFIVPIPTGKRSISKMLVCNQHTSLRENTVNISLVVAYDKMKGIGKNNQLLWSLPADMEWFRLITTGKPVIMGKNTYRSIGKPLKDRTNIVLTSDLDFEEEGVTPLILF